MKKKYGIVGILALTLIFIPSVLSITDNNTIPTTINMTFNEVNLNTNTGPVSRPWDPGDVDFPIIFDGEDNPPP